jgi:hypothetical protein
MLNEPCVVNLRIKNMYERIGLDVYTNRVFLRI